MPSSAEVVAIVAVGDSKLIDFCNRAARPSPKNPHLYFAMKTISDLQGALPVKVWYRHVLRDANKLADWGARVAKILERDVDLRALGEGNHPANPPTITPELAAKRLAMPSVSMLGAIYTGKHPRDGGLTEALRGSTAIRPAYSQRHRCTICT